MNLEHTRLMDVGLGRRNDAQLLVNAVDREASITRAMDRLRALIKSSNEAKDHQAVEDFLALAVPAQKELHEATRWANHYRAKVQQNIKEESARVAQVEVQA